MLTADLRAVLAKRPLGLVFDIDGTLSPIAPTPDEARLYPGIAPLLERLRTHAHVAIMTGRAIADGSRIVSVDDVTYVGNHGLEWSEGLPEHHPVQIVPEARKYVEPARHLLDLVEERLVPEMPGLFIQRKSIGGSVHYRLSPEPEEARRRILELLEEPARAAGLTLNNGKMVVDIQVPGLNKGEALLRYAGQLNLRGALFAGDDRTDLDALKALARLRQEGCATYGIVVQHSDTLPELLAQADLVVQGVPGMFELLRELAECLESGK